MKIAFVYDWFDTEIGGAERVLKVLHDMYPSAPWYTSHIEHKAVPWAKDWDIRPSFLQRLPLWFRRNRILSLPLLPLAFESLDLSAYDVVISVSSGFAKNVITTANTRHICYLLTPPRWLYKKVLSSKFQVLGKIVDLTREYLISWDRMGARRVDEYISISKEVARRCKEFYGRDSDVLYPPFEYEKWKVISSKFHIPSEKKPIKINLELGTRNLELFSKSYFIVVSRLKKYKRVDLAIEAYAKLKEQRAKSKVKLVIVGRGSEKDVLKSLSIKYQVSNDIVWFERVTDEELARLYTGAIALVMPQEEDFGYTACEAIACRCPVVVYDRGGQTEIVTDGVTGVYFHNQTPDALCAALEKILSFEYNQEPYENSHIRGWSRHSFVASFSQKIPKTV